MYHQRTENTMCRKRTMLNWVLLSFLIANICLQCPTASAADVSFRGPLRVHPDNPRYFTDGSGRVIYLTGSHTWANLVDIGPKDPPPRFDFTACLKWMQRLNHNFIRMWTWEPVTWNTKANRENKLHTAAPQPWARTGPGKSLDGKPKFDLKKFNPAYFDRLRRRVSAARDRGIYVSVMLFEGWAMQFSVGAWEGHPFNPKNNVNGIDGDKNKDGRGLEIHTLANPAVTKLQEAYVRKVIDTVNNFDNVLYEISNENHPPSTKWQYHIIRYIKSCEKKKPKQHPVGMTFQYRAGKNETLFKSPADWISPNNEGGYRDNPPAADGRKVVLNDTDHLWGIGGNQAWVWKSFLRGHNPIFMDPYDGVVLGKRFDSKWDPIRRSMGYARRYAEKMNLTAMRPRNNLASTKYCLANPGIEYLVYNPAADKSSITVNLKAGTYKYEWFNPDNGKVASTGTIKTKDAKKTFEAPFRGDAVLYLKAKRQVDRQYDDLVEKKPEQPVEKYVYKQTPQGQLAIYVHQPEDWNENDKRPAIVFFFGGGWRGGTVRQFEPQAKYLASRGMVAACADYRVRSRHGTTPDKCVEDAKSAIRWLRTNASRLGIDTSRIAAAGGSAGGHIAACSYTTKGLEAEGEDLSVSSKPNLLVLSNPVLNCAGMAERMGSREMAIKISPNHNLTKDVPPAVIFYGTEDRLGAGGKEFVEKSKKLGTTAELYTAEGQKHGFFNRSPWLERTMYVMDKFLTRYGYIQGEPTVELPQGKVAMKKTGSTGRD